MCKNTLQKARDQLVTHISLMKTEPTSVGSLGYYFILIVYFRTVKIKRGFYLGATPQKLEDIDQVPQESLRDYLESLVLRFLH